MGPTNFPTTAWRAFSCHSWNAITCNISNWCSLIASSPSVFALPVLVLLRGTPTVISRMADYYDVLLLGRTGFGKSTTGNKLLGVMVDRESGEFVSHENIVEWSSQFKLLNSVFTSEGLPPIFPQSQAKKSCTKMCHLLSNETSRIRVLDVAGFANTKSVGVKRGNLGILRQVIRVQEEHNATFNRVLYFLPCRGPPEKADSALQEELQVMHYFCGNAIFENMIIVATLSSRKNYPDSEYQELDENFSDTTEAVQEALNIVIENDVLLCPPIIYLARDEAPGSVVNKVQQTRVTSSLNGGLKLSFREDTCSRCAVKFVYNVKDRHRGFVITGDERELTYEETKCHPWIIPRYTRVQKVVGGIFHIITLGIGVAGDWPGFYNTEEMCVKCKEPPGTEGCMKCTEVYQLKAEDGTTEPVTVLHKSKLDEVQVTR